MILNHLNLTVTDVAAATDFLVTYFGLVDEGGNRGFRLLRDDRGMTLTLMKAKTADYPATFHIGFDQGDETAVTALNGRLQADGFDVDPPVREHAFTFYVKAPGGFTVEIMA